MPPSLSLFPQRLLLLRSQSSSNTARCPPRFRKSLPSRRQSKRYEASLHHLELITHLNLFTPPFHQSRRPLLVLLLLLLLLLRSQPSRNAARCPRKLLPIRRLWLTRSEMHEQPAARWQSLLPRFQSQRRQK